MSKGLFFNYSAYFRNTINALKTNLCFHLPRPRAKYKDAPETINPNTIEVYPNPAQNEINLLAKPNQTFTLYNVSGATVRQGRTQEGGLTRINTQALLNGVYFLYLDGKTVSFTVKH